MVTIAQVNDFFRRAILTNPVRGGKCVVTQGVNALDPDTKKAILAKVRTFANFTQDNDPYGEHEFGAFEVAGVGKVFWKDRLLLGRHDAVWCRGHHQGVSGADDYVSV